MKTIVRDDDINIQPSPIYFLSQKEQQYSVQRGMSFIQIDIMREKRMETVENMAIVEKYLYSKEKLLQCKWLHSDQEGVSGEKRELKM